MILVWDPCDCYDIAVGLLWYCCGIDVGSLWDLCGISGGIVGECCDLAMVLSWSCCVISRGILMVLLGDYSDTAMVGMLFCEIAGGLLGYYYYYYGIALGLLRHCCDLVVGFL